MNSRNLARDIVLPFTVVVLILIIYATGYRRLCCDQSAWDTVVAWHCDVLELMSGFSLAALAMDLCASRRLQESVSFMMYCYILLGFIVVLRLISYLVLSVCASIN